MLEHTRTERMVLFKICINTDSPVKKLGREIAEKHQPNPRVWLINFAGGIVGLTTSKQIEKFSKDWYSKT